MEPWRIARLFSAIYAKIWLESRVFGAASALWHRFG
jgi:hypothetical protein